MNHNELRGRINEFVELPDEEFALLLKCVLVRTQTRAGDAGYP